MLTWKNEKIPSWIVLEIQRADIFYNIYYIQSNSVPRIFVNYSSEIVITVNIYVVKLSFRTKKVGFYLFVVPSISFFPSLNVIAFNKQLPLPVYKNQLK